MQEQVAAAFDVYGFRFHIVADTARGAAEGLADDFAFFRRESVEHPWVIALYFQDPPYDGVPSRAASVYTPRNVSFSEGKRTYIDYSGRALAI